MLVALPWSPSCFLALSLTLSRSLAAATASTTAAPACRLWERVNRTSECLADPNQELWADRHDEYCRVFWPPERAGHVAVLDGLRNGMWLHGGFRTHYPYLSTPLGAAPSGKTRVPFNSYSCVGYIF